MSRSRTEALRRPQGAKPGPGGLPLVQSILIGAAVLAATMLTGACHHPQAERMERGKLIMALESGFPSLDPLHVSNLAERQVALMVMDPLFDLGADGELVPVLATGFEVLDEGHRYRISLREGVRFHDGTRFDAAAVQINLDRMRDPDNACRCLPLLDDIESIEVIDEHHVDIHLVKPNATIPAVLAAAPGLMVSPSWIALAGDSESRHPVGAGPFRLTEWQRGRRIVLKDNPDYWHPDRPHLKRLELRPLPNEESRHAALLAGDVDVIQTPHPRFSAQYADNPAYALMTSEGLGSVFLMMNTREPPFDDPRVRRAIAHATDRELFVSAIFQDQYPVADNPVGPGSWGHSRVPDFPAHDPSRARELLDSAEGPIEFELSIVNAPFMSIAAQALQEMWEPFGIEVEIKAVDAARFFNNILHHRFEMAFSRFAGRSDPDLTLYRSFHSSYADRVPSTNYTGFSDPEMDRLLEAGRQELDRSKREAIYAEVANLLARAAVYLPLFHTTFQTMMRDGLDPGPNVADGVLRLDRASWQ